MQDLFTDCESICLQKTLLMASKNIEQAGRNLAVAWKDDWFRIHCTKPILALSMDRRVTEKMVGWL